MTGVEEKFDAALNRGDGYCLGVGERSRAISRSSVCPFVGGDCGDL